MYKPTLHSHTITHGLLIFNGVREPQAVCQAAPANANTQAWRQRVSAPPHPQNDRQTNGRRTPNR